MKTEKDLERHYTTKRRIEKMHRVMLVLTAILPVPFLEISVFTYWFVVILVLISWICYAIGFSEVGNQNIQSVKSGVRYMLKAWLLMAIVAIFFYFVWLSNK